MGAGLMDTSTLASLGIGVVTIIVSVLLSIRFGDMAAARHSEKVTRQLEDERQDRERQSVLRLLNQWVTAQQDAVSELWYRTQWPITRKDGFIKYEIIDFSDITELFETHTLDLVLHQYVIDADEIELRMLFALRRHLSAANEAVAGLLGCGLEQERFWMRWELEPIPTRITDAVSALEDVHHWLRPKLR